VRLVCPYTELHPATERALRPLGAEFVDVGDSEYAYWRLLKRLWAEREPFTLVEHDVEPTATQLRWLWDCPEPVCSYEYLYRGQSPVSALGCTKFGAGALERPMTWSYRWSVIAHEGDVRWQDACAYLLQQLPPAHLHSGLVTHHGAKP
jgi:hypothetical protein